MFRRLLIISIISFLAVSCVREDVTQCKTGEFRLNFEFTHNNQGENLLDGNVQDIRIYIFNQGTGILTEEVRVTVEDLKRGHVDISLPEGTYTFSTWGGSSEDMMKGGYLDAQMIDEPANVYISPARIGSATIEDFRMMLTFNGSPIGRSAETMPEITDFDDLFFAIARDIRVAVGSKDKITFDFIRNSHKIKVKISGLEYLPDFAAAPGVLTRDAETELPVEIFAIGNNGLYCYDNQIGTYAQYFRYNPRHAYLVSSAVQVDIMLLRLDMVRHTAEPMMLYVRDKITGRDLIDPLDIVGTILQAKDPEGHYIYQTQEDLDREDEYPIEISILRDLSIRITVNGFEIREPDADVTRPKARL